MTTTLSHEESLDRALADVELLLSAYPDEAKAIHDDDSAASFPLRVQLTLSETALITLEWEEGYPVKSSIQIQSYRSSPNEKLRMEITVTAVRAAAAEALGDQVEAGFMCAAAARDVWDAHLEAEHEKEEELHMVLQATLAMPPSKVYEWKTGEPLIDRKSSFLCHICRIEKESDVKPALSQLLESSKLQRATHNMVSTSTQINSTQRPDCLLNLQRSRGFRISGHTECEKRRMDPTVY